MDAEERNMKVVPISGSGPGFEAELRISPRPVLAVLVVLGLLLAWGGEILSYPYEVVQQAVWLFLVVLGLSAISWLCLNWKPLLGRWLTVFTLAATICLASFWLDVPDALSLSAIPAALTVALISLPAAVVVAASESLFLVLLLGYPATELNATTAIVALVAIWAILGVMSAAYHPAHQLAEWMEGYFDRARHALAEAQNRKAEFEQTVQGLANANRQLALANERMAALRAIAEEARRAKTAFVASVSHEFRTPLNMIVGLVELMVETPEIYAVMLSPKMRSDLETVYRNCERLSSMINDILDLTRVEAGRLALHREQIDLREIVDSSVAAVGPLLEQKLLSMHIAIPDDLPEIYCDRTRIEQVILNLLSNAARFTEEGGITVEAVRQDQHVLVSVTDTGSGISPEDVERIFEPFWQGTGELWRDKGGSGLGLSISRRFVELHGGRMWLESKLGAGASFFFTLPLASPIEHIVRPGHAIREDWVWREHAFGAGRVVSADQLVRPRLIICDEIGSLYPQFVRYSDEVELIVAQNLTQAMQELQVCPAHVMVFNTLASDNLWSVMEAARQEAPGTPIIGCSVPREVERAIDAGALGYLVKPVTRAALEAALDAVGEPVERVLVVDDDPDVLQLFSQMLHVCDSTLDVVTASSGKEALEELHRISVDLMLLDIIMPDMDGWQILESVAQDKEMKAIPTFFVSAQDPADQPPVSEFLLTTMNGGLSPSKLLRCSLEMSRLLLEPEAGLDLVPV